MFTRWSKISNLLSLLLVCLSIDLIRELNKWRVYRFVWSNILRPITKSLVNFSPNCLTAKLSIKMCKIQNHFNPIQVIYLWIIKEFDIFLKTKVWLNSIYIYMTNVRNKHLDRISFIFSRSLSIDFLWILSIELFWK